MAQKWLSKSGHSLNIDVLNSELNMIGMQLSVQLKYLRISMITFGSMHPSLAFSDVPFISFFRGWKCFAVNFKSTVKGRFSEEVSIFRGGCLPGKYPWLIPNSEEFNCTNKKVRIFTIAALLYLADSNILDSFQMCFLHIQVLANFYLIELH